MTTLSLAGPISGRGKCLSIDRKDSTLFKGPVVHQSSTFPCSSAPEHWLSRMGTFFSPWTQNWLAGHSQCLHLGRAERRGPGAGTDSGQSRHGSDTMPPWGLQNFWPSPGNFKELPSVFHMCSVSVCIYIWHILPIISKCLIATGF